MNPRLLVQLRRCNTKLKETAWENYLNFLRLLFRSSSHPSAGVLAALVERKDFDGLLREADRLASAEYGTSAEHRLCNQFAAVIRKYPFPKGLLSSDPEGAATEKFLHSEHRCKRVNQRFAAYLKVRSPHEKALNQARTWIQYVLGDLDLSDVWSSCDFGPGASMGVHGNATNSARKLLSSKWSVTPGAFYYAYAALIQDDHIRELVTRTTPHVPYYPYDNSVFLERLKERVRLIDYNKVVFVPKTARVHRTIAVEPLLNGYIQKGIDVFMRKRLKRVGIDLTDQTLNQEMARKGSSCWYDPDPYVTIDLSSASDSISIGLCRYMLPPDWFDFLNSCRSSCYNLNGDLHRYHKFTTMGNGFCFPLETLLFASLCNTAYVESGTKPDFSVYGDDIIVRQSVANRVLQLLDICGFKANTDKTFLSGPFRESCGADWFSGEDVRPLSLDYAFDSLENIFKFCNLSRSKGAWECIFYEAREFLKSLIPRSLMFARPYKGNADTALEVPWDEFMASPYSRWDRNVQSWSWVELLNTAMADVSVKRVAGYDVALIRGALTGSTSPIPFALRRNTRTNTRRYAFAGCTSLLLPFGSGMVVRPPRAAS